MDVLPTQIELIPGEIAILGSLAAGTGKSPRELLSEAVQNYQPKANHTNGSRRPTLLERLSRKGLIGCLHGGPSDLSTNPAHMEGFGRD